MNNSCNLKLYDFYAPRCVRLFGWLYRRPQRRAVALLNVQPGERVFVPGAGAGMGLAELRTNAQITAIDLSPAMVAQARRKLAGRAIHFEVMDAQQLRYGDGSFDAVLLSLILSVVPDGGRPAHAGAWRVTALGAGPKSIPRRQLSVERLATAITEATTSPAIQARAAALGCQIRAEDGVGTVVRLLSS